MASGKDSPQYKIVTDNYEDIIDALEANNAAYKTLRRKVKAKEWLRAAENPPAEELVTIIQNRIRRDPSDYDVFMDMLHDTDGMDQVAKKLQLPGGAGPEDVKTLDFRKFGKPDIKTLMNLVGAELKAKWEPIGDGLGVKTGDLKDFQLTMVTSQMQLSTACTMSSISGTVLKHLSTAGKILLMC